MLMAKVREDLSTGNLFFDFRYQGRRYREYSALKETLTNRKKMEAMLKRVMKEIKNDTYDHAKYFPNSKVIKKESNVTLRTDIHSVSKAVATATNPNLAGLPTFEEFADIWVSENEISWRKSHHKTQMGIIDGHLKPVFRDKVVSNITKAEILAFRASLAKVKGRKNSTLSAKRINSIMAPLRQILNEAADRYEFNTPYRNIKPLKVPKTDIEPFPITEVQKILTQVRPDYKNYYTVRFFTGMRTGEIDGLKWKYIDFENHLILIRETVVGGKEDYTKNDSSQREIQMSQLVYDALKLQHENTSRISKFVFCNKEGKHLDHNNITKRVWYPLLANLGLNKRRPYQTRHTAATLWLASGENPEWISRQMGHTTTEMLFRVYSRFVPNLTRKDGSAFEYLLAQHNVGLNNKDDGNE